MKDYEYLIDAIKNAKVLNEKITVYGWQFTYDHILRGSIIPFLNEPISIIENIAPETNENRDGRIREKKYITVHDTGDTKDIHTAKFWSDTVKEEKLQDTHDKYAASFQYVVGNDGIYHNIPDDEIAYHAGDTTKFDYKLYKTNVAASDKAVLTIKDDMFYINGENTLLSTPTTANNEILRTENINDQGITIKAIDGYFYIGENYYNETYKLISNRGGNNNSIGMEVCINEGTDLYYTYQLSAKLCAHLMIQNNLTLDDIKQHHFFSGKNCPQTLRRANLWNYFLSMVNAEYHYLKLINSGYKVSVICDDKDVLPNGRIKNIECVKDINFRIKFILKDDIKEFEFVKTITPVTK